MGYRLSDWRYSTDRKLVRVIKFILFLLLHLLTLLAMINRQIAEYSEDLLANVIQAKRWGTQCIMVQVNGINFKMTHKESVVITL